MSEYYGVQRSEDYLAHYGVKGMKWRVRRYLDGNGKFSKKSLARYGKNATKKASPLRSQVDHNRMNQLIADMNAEKADTSQLIDHYKNKASKRSDKYLRRNPSASRKEANRYAMNKYGKKIDNYKNVYSTADQYIKGAKNLQNSILDKAKKNNYSISKKNKTWYGTSTQDRTRMASYNASLGALGPGLYYSDSVMNNKSKQYNAPKVKIRRKR